MNAGFVGLLGSLEPSRDDFVAGMLLQQVNGVGRSYVRERRQAARKLVSEIYSPPRVTAEIRRGRWKHLAPGFALDLTVLDADDGKPWDFDVAAKREKARRMVREQKPYLLIGSPACTAFCTWQALNAIRSECPEQYERARIAAIAHIDFVCSLYEEQLSGGRYFLHEHPIGASSWEIQSIKKLLETPGFTRVRGDQCQYGAGAVNGRPVMKPSGFMTNAAKVAGELNLRCQYTSEREQT